MKFKSPRPSATPGKADRFAVAHQVDPQRCQFATSDARRCRMPRWEGHPYFCVFHARLAATEERKLQRLREADSLAAELASLSGEFTTASDVNHVLGNLFRLAASGRIPPRTAATLAYIGQLLLHTLHRVRDEIITARDFAGWTAVLRRAFPPPSPAEVLRPSLMPFARALEPALRSSSSHLLATGLPPAESRGHSSLATNSFRMRSSGSLGLKWLC